MFGEILQITLTLRRIYKYFAKHLWNFSLNTSRTVQFHVLFIENIRTQSFCKNHALLARCVSKWCGRIFLGKVGSHSVIQNLLLVFCNYNDIYTTIFWDVLIVPEHSSYFLTSYDCFSFTNRREWNEENNKTYVNNKIIVVVGIHVMQKTSIGVICYAGFDRWPPNTPMAPVLTILDITALNVTQ